MCVEMISIDVTTVGGDGSATATVESPTPICGELLAVYVNYHASAPGTTTVDINGVTTGQKIMDLAAANTDVIHHIRRIGSTNAGVALTAGDNINVPFALAEKVNCVVALSDALTKCVSVHLLVRM